MQLRDVAQEMPDIVLLVTSGSGDCPGSTAHFVPFQSSPAGRVTPLLVTNPAATHLELMEQDTLESSLVPPEGTAVFCTVQLFPFHRSASGTMLLEALTKSPTAVQALAAVQETPARWVPRPPVGVGVVWILQEVPFHTSAHVWVSSDPTASHEVEEVHDTALSWLVVEPNACGAVSRVQAVPFQCSASGNCFPEPLM